MSTYPDTYRYTKEHEWVAVEGDTATVGITFHAQKELGDIVYVDLPKPGLKLNAGDTFGSVESVKAVSDIYSPVAGEELSRRGRVPPLPPVLVDTTSSRAASSSPPTRPTRPRSRRAR
jgi:glycine cleavage system H protein